MDTIVGTAHAPKSVARRNTANHERGDAGCVCLGLIDAASGPPNADPERPAQ